MRRAVFFARHVNPGTRRRRNRVELRRTDHTSRRRTDDVRRRCREKHPTIFGQSNYSAWYHMVPRGSNRWFT